MNGLQKEQNVLNSLSELINTNYRSALLSGASSVSTIDRKIEELQDISISELLDSEEFLNTKEWLYPCHRQDIITIFELKKKYDIHTVLDEEGIGSGKSTKLALLIALQIFKLGMKPNPQDELGLAPDRKIAFIMMSKNADKAKKVTFTEFLPLCNNKFFMQYLTPSPTFAEVQNKRIYPSELKFPKNILVFPGTGAAASALGYNIYGAVIDEANYLEWTADSKKTAFGGTSFAVYDAAKMMYDEIFTRMTSRYMRAGGRIPGLLVLSSNPSHNETFMERLISQADVESVDSSGERWVDIKNKMMIIKRPLWSALKDKKGVYCGKTFKFDFKNCRVVNDAS
ncbi:hypothetical protein C4561_01790 [candidate division WWE3 bacterium]|uniref:Terminase n=1 Tax=candidate division WWE3 bacterium TaxID=2053526 RepID=A0A3A4ZER5_UNCKA|nr:MAG: hypothetical protein C4561_01790 [candidate division WWE3 bacterium]